MGKGHGAEICYSVRLKILRRGGYEGETAEAKRIYKIISYLNDHLEEDISRGFSRQKTEGLKSGLILYL
jgi:hypothetical protein